MNERSSLFGLKIDSIPLSQALKRAEQTLAEASLPALAVFTPNLEMLDRARKSKSEKRLLNSGDLLLPDGIGIALVARLLNKRLPERSAGIELGERLLELASRRGERVFLLGGEAGVAKRAEKALKARYPSLDVCGTRNGFIESEKEKKAALDLINDRRPSVLIVCMGYPRQERFVAQNKSRLPSVRVFACLGGSLDVWSGKKVRAPLPLRALCLEWLWRIANEPQRLKRFVPSLATLGAALTVKIKRTHNAPFRS